MCDQGSLVGLCTQDCKSLCAVVTICATLVNIQTYTQRQTAFWPAYMNRSANWAKKTSQMFQSQTPEPTLKWHPGCASHATERFTTSQSRVVIPTIYHLFGDEWQSSTPHELVVDSAGEHVATSRTACYQLNLVLLEIFPVIDRNGRLQTTDTLFCFICKSTDECITCNSQCMNCINDK